MRESKPSTPPIYKSLSARLLVLTVFFVMLAEVLIYVPSITRFRKVYLEEHIAKGHLAALSLEATPDQMVTPDLTKKLLFHAEAHAVALRREDQSMLALVTHDMPDIDKTIRLPEGTPMDMIEETFLSMLQTQNRVLRVIGPSPKEPGLMVEVVLDEAPMRAAMNDYSGRILALSIVIALITATLVYISLYLLMVRPMRQITESMARFREAPEDASRTIETSDRSDEVGFARRELKVMQDEVRTALLQKTHLAALGATMTKINHDLRNSLATAMLLSDQLSNSKDPKVREQAPRLMDAISRSINLCSQTLDFARDKPPEVRLSDFRLGDLVEELSLELIDPAQKSAPKVKRRFSDDLEIHTDREQLRRCMMNLIRNALDAGAKTVTIGVESNDDEIKIRINDNGPGLSKDAQDNLFVPFKGSTKEGGAGLGLVIARDIMHALGGELTLGETSKKGTTFVLSLPRKKRKKG